MKASVWWRRAQLFHLHFIFYGDGVANVVADADPDCMVIPASFGTKPAYPVVAIGAAAFSYCESLTKVTIPDSITSTGMLSLTAPRFLQPDSQAMHPVSSKTTFFTTRRLISTAGGTPSPGQYSDLTPTPGTETIPTTTDDPSTNSSSQPTGNFPGLFKLYRRLSCSVWVSRSAACWSIRPGTRNSPILLKTAESIARLESTYLMILKNNDAITGSN